MYETVISPNRAERGGAELVRQDLKKVSDSFIIDPLFIDTPRGGIREKGREIQD